LGRNKPSPARAAFGESGARCEAQFYSGKWHILQNKPAEAGAALRKAVETCPKTFTEYAAAQAELKRLNP
jgi:hypothetical protein